MSVTIRSATSVDVPAIAAIINDYAEQGQMLHRSHAELYERLRDYYVAEEGEKVMGVCGLRVIWGNLAEVYALAVASDAGGKGVGRKLVEASVGEAERLGVRRIFALTYQQAFFERCGFGVVDRMQELPQKVWSECVRCPKNQACDEIAVVRVLEHVADTTEASKGAGVGLPVLYDVPVLSDTIRRLEKGDG